jgi:hypothetical protein
MRDSALEDLDVNPTACKLLDRRTTVPWVAAGSNLKKPEKELVALPEPSVRALPAAGTDPKTWAVTSRIAPAQRRQKTCENRDDAYSSRRDDRRDPPIEL